jgi:hypothetical protein
METMNMADVGLCGFLKAVRLTWPRIDAIERDLASGAWSPDRGFRGDALEVAFIRYVRRELPWLDSIEHDYTWGLCDPGTGSHVAGQPVDEPFVRQVAAAVRRLCPGIDETHQQYTRDLSDGPSGTTAAAVAFERWDDELEMYVFREEDHPRGQPGNRGQFREKDAPPAGDAADADKIQGRRRPLVERSVGVAMRGRQRQKAGDWSARTAGALVRSELAVIRDKSSSQQEIATAVERMFAHIMHWERWGGSAPADLAGLVRNRHTGKWARVGVDMKAAISRSKGVIAVNPIARQANIAFAAETLLPENKGMAGYGQPSVMALVGLNLSRSIDAGLLHVKATIAGTDYEKMTPIEVQGLNGVEDMAKPDVLRRVREKVLSALEDIDMGEYKKDLVEKAKQEHKDAVHRAARLADHLKALGGKVENEDEAKLGRLLNASDHDPELAKKLKEFGIL